MTGRQSTTSTNVVPLRSWIQEVLRRKVCATVEDVLREELAAALGTERYERSEGRHGYRNGSERRSVTTEMGAVEVDVPRARIQNADGTTREFRSEVLPRYARRTRRVDEAMLGAYLAGANTRRIRLALRPLLGSANLSKSAISRVVTRLRGRYAEWCDRGLSTESYAILYLDAIHLKVRLVRRVISVPVLVALGVMEDGEKRIVALRLATSGSQGAWGSLVEDLLARGLCSPKLLVSDGHAGLRKALETWSEVQIQRCTQHKLDNLLDHCPKHAHPELRRDYRRITHAADGLEAREAYDTFLVKWRRLCPTVARSLEEAGLRLLTFYEFPKSTWKSLRSTNAIESVNREFRRRVKTQGSFSTEAAAVTLLFGLVAFGYIRPRRIDGYKDLSGFLVESGAKAA